MAGVDVHVTIPEGTESELLTFAASLWGTEAAVAADDETICREAYEGGTSEYWRPFLIHLAKHADEWVPLEGAFKAAGLTTPKGIGMLGAAERRCGAGLPYEKRWKGGKREFRMNARAAGVVLSLAAAE
jgi:hypothetical protein